MAFIRTVRGLTPQIGNNVFLAENSVIIGEVEIGDNSSVWYNVVLRGDVHSIQIGQNTNVQDGTIVHCTYQKAATTIGNHVTIGHSAVIHGCTLHDFVLVGMGAIIMDHAVVEKDTIIAAGSLLLERTRAESGFLYAGRPAKKIKPLSPEQIEGIRTYSQNYLMYSQWFLQS